MKQWTWICCSVCLALFLSACSQSGEAMRVMTEVAAISEADTESTPVPVVSTGKTVVADGELISPYPQLALAFEGNVSGQVLDVAVQAGDIIAAGDLLAVLDDEDLIQAVEDAQRALDRATLDEERAQQQWEQDLADAELSLESAQRALQSARLQSSTTSLEEARTALEHAQRVEHDAKKAYDTPVFGDWTPPEQREQQYNTWQNAIRERELAELRLQDAQDTRGVNLLDITSREMDVKQAEMKLASLQRGVEPSYARAVEDAQLELDKAKVALDNARLVAPWDALVLSVDVAPKAVIAAGTPVVSLLSMEDGLRFITQNLSEQHVASIQPGQPVSVTLRTFPETPVAGVVEAIVPQTETQNATDARFAVRARLEANDLSLLPGLTGRIEVFTE